LTARPAPVGIEVDEYVLSSHVGLFQGCGPRDFGELNSILRTGYRCDQATDEIPGNADSGFHGKGFVGNEQLPKKSTMNASLNAPLFWFTFSMIYHTAR